MYKLSTIERMKPEILQEEPETVYRELESTRDISIYESFMTDEALDVGSSICAWFICHLPFDC